MLEFGSDILRNPLNGQLIFIGLFVVGTVKYLAFEAETIALELRG